ncbi:MAG: hypothetical protein U0930_19045 [Pirellulales bacterium]
MQQFVSSRIEHADVQIVGMQVDFAVELVLNIVEPHHESPWVEGETAVTRTMFYRVPEFDLKTQSAVTIFAGSGPLGRLPHPRRP